jgi:hypothetical protein
MVHSSSCADENFVDAAVAKSRSAWAVMSPSGNSPFSAFQQDLALWPDQHAAERMVAVFARPRRDREGKPQAGFVVKFVAHNPSAVIIREGG